MGDPRSESHRGDVTKRDQEPMKPGRGESRGRREGLGEHGGRPLTEELQDGVERGVDEEGKPSTGTHGGPSKGMPSKGGASKGDASGG